VDPSDAPEPTAPQTPAWIPRLGRGRRDAPARYLLEGRVFRLLCNPGQTAALDAFRASLERHRLGPEGSLPDFGLTPFAFLDAVGIEPPHFETSPLPINVIKAEESFLVTGYVVKTAKDFFEKEPVLQAAALKKRVEELKERADPEAHELIDQCLTRFVSREGFEVSIYNQLAFDVLYRFRFPEVLREQIFDFLGASLLAGGESVPALSKMRIIKTFWDRNYERLLKKHPGAKAEIQALDREIMLRTFKDFLSWEVIHHSILGYAGEDQAQPVTAFTLEPEATLKARSTAYKCALRAFLDQINREELANTLQPRLAAWKPGLLVPVQEDGSFDTVIAPGELQVY